MKKVFLSVDVPAISNRYDFKVPLNMKIKDGIILMYQIIGEEYVGILKNVERASLFMLECGVTLDKDLRFSDYQLMDEDKLILL